MPFERTSVVLVRMLVMALCLGCASGARGQNVNTNALRTWTSTAGQTLAARFVALRNERVSLETAEGARREIAVAALSAADRQYLEVVAPAGPMDLLPGKWLGSGTLNGDVARCQLTVTSMGGHLRAQGIVSVALSQEQLAAVRSRRAPKGDVQFFACAMDVAYEVLVDKNAVTFKPVSAKALFEAADVKNRWIGRELTGTFARPALVSGVWKSAPAKAGEKKVADGIFCLHKEHALDSPPPLTLAKGKKVDLTCEGNPAFHYSCYIPQKYDPAVPTPVVVNKNPGGNGQPLSPKMAEELGWIMVGLKESSNTEPRSTDNFVAALFDLRRRFNIDMERLYFSGFSGRARQSSEEAIGFPDECAGLILIGAGFCQYYEGPRRAQYRLPPVHVPVFFLVGATDMNNDEVTARMAPMAQKRRQVFKLKVHPGAHTWGRPEDHEEAIRWLDEQWKATAAQRKNSFRR